MKIHIHQNFMGTIAIVVGAVLLVAGCGPAKRSLHELDHVQPAHWPAGLADAAKAIRLRLSIVHGSQPGERQIALSELQDIVAWTAEIAADTDLTEVEWLPIYTACESARQQLKDITQLPPGLSVQLEQLCQILDDSEQSLAGQSGKTDSAHAPESQSR